jgi:hypothetical protein
MTKIYKCGHYANMSIIASKVDYDPAVSELILDQAVSSVLCYTCLKVLYEADPGYIETGYTKPWHKSVSIASRAYAHLLRHIAVISGLKCNKDCIYPRYWIEDIWGIESKFKEGVYDSTLRSKLQLKKQKDQDEAIKGLLSQIEGDKNE